MKFVRLQTRTWDCDSTPTKNVQSHDAPETYSNQVEDPLHIERPQIDTIIFPPKDVIWKSIHNPSLHAAQHYNIVEYLTQAPCAMSTLEVLKNCPHQWQTLLSAIRAFDLDTSGLISFNVEKVSPRLSSHLAFQIQVGVRGKKIHRTIIDEGASTCIMLLPCWKDIGSPELAQSPTRLKKFDGRSFIPYGILHNLPIQFGGKTRENFKDPYLFRSV